jgi:hypothetical protein
VKLDVTKEGGGTCTLGFFPEEHPELCAERDHLLPCGCPVGIVQDEGHQDGCDERTTP